MPLGRRQPRLDASCLGVVHPSVQPILVKIISTELNFFKFCTKVHLDSRMN